MTEADRAQCDSVLESIVKRPAMYWGDSDNHFHSFVAFVSGCQPARSDVLGEEARQQLDQLIPPRFHEFVTEYYGHTFPYGGYGWTTFIEEVNHGLFRRILPWGNEACAWHASNLPAAPRNASGIL